MHETTHGIVNAYVEGNWQGSYTAEEFRRGLLDKIAKENVWHCGYNRYLDRIFSAFSCTSVNLFVEGMDLIDCVWKDEKSGLRIDVGGERGDSYYFVMKIGPKYGLGLHGIGEPKYFDAQSCPKSCQIGDDHILKELEGYLRVAVKAIHAKKEFDSTTYRAKLLYTTTLGHLGINVNWKESGHTDLR